MKKWLGAITVALVLACALIETADTWDAICAAWCAAGSILCAPPICDPATGGSGSGS